MMAFREIFMGVDPSGGDEAISFAVVDENCKSELIKRGNIQEFIEFCKAKDKIFVAVNAPQRLNKGLIRKRMEEKKINPGQLRGTDLRVCEYELHEHGIHISSTPSNVKSCPAWVASGFGFYDLLERNGFQPYPAADAPRQWLETHPHAGFCVLLGQLPLPKISLLGRLQRQLVLFEQGMSIQDPMDFFEEITRHRMLRGDFPLNIIHTAEELDVLIAAITAYKAIKKPGEVTLVGEKSEGQVVLPVPALFDAYQ